VKRRTSSIGKRTTLATIEKLQLPPKNNFGEREPTFQSAGQWWVAVRELRGNELAAAAQRVATVTHEVKGDFRTDITSRDRLTFDGRVLEINWVDNVDQRNVELRCVCTETIE